MEAHRVATDLLVKDGEYKVRHSRDKRICKITGLAYLPDGKLCVCDSNNSVCKLLDENYRIVSRLEFSAFAFDVAVISETEVAVTVPEEHALYVLRVTKQRSLEFKRKISVGKECYGIHCWREKIYVTCGDGFLEGKGEILVLSGPDGQEKTRIGLTCVFTWPRYVAVSNHGNVYITDANTHLVTGLDGDGNERYMLAHKHLQRPSGLVVNADESIFVCGDSSDNVFFIRPDRNTWEIALTVSDGLMKPKSISYRAQDRTMAVGMLDRDTVLVFRVSAGITGDSVGDDSNPTPITQLALSENVQDVSLIEAVPGTSDSDDIEVISDLRVYKKKALATGPASTVYGEQFEHSIPVAVKKIYMAQTDSEGVLEQMRVLREIETARQMSVHGHPNIVRFFKSETKAEFLYLAFELCQGTLVDYVDVDSNWSKLLPWKHVLRQMTSGLHFLHDTVNLAHRDLKPTNVLLVQSQHVKVVLADFGQSKLMKNLQCSISGQPGTLGWIAREVDEYQMDGRPYHQSSDIFPLGCLFFYVATSGKHPFGPTPLIQQAHITLEKPDLLGLPPHLLCLQVLISDMISFKPEERPSTGEILSNLALFDDAVIMKFLHKASNLINNYQHASQNILEDATVIPGANWLRLLPVNTQAYLSSFTLPRHQRPMFQGKEASVRHLLRAIRNCSEHFKDLDATMRAEMGSSHTDHVQFWLTHFPWLLTHVYDRMKGDQELMDSIHE